VASIAAAYVPTTASVSSLWSSLKDGVFLASNVQQVEIKTDDDYARVSMRLDVLFRHEVGNTKQCALDKL
jgi:hypothetical protein